MRCVYLSSGKLLSISDAATIQQDERRRQNYTNMFLYFSLFTWAKDFVEGSGSREGGVGLHFTRWRATYGNTKTLNFKLYNAVGLKKGAENCLLVLLLVLLNTRRLRRANLFVSEGGLQLI